MSNKSTSPKGIVNMGVKLIKHKSIALNVNIPTINSSPQVESEEYTDQTEKNDNDEFTSTTE